MPRRGSPLQSEILQGTLDMLVLRTLVLGPAHGHCPFDRAQLRGCPSDRAWFAVSGLAPARRSRVDRVLLGNVGKQPQSALLPPNTRRTQAVAYADEALGATGPRDWPCSQARHRVKTHEHQTVFPPRALGSRTRAGNRLLSADRNR
jgi:hypothetical protein